LTPDQLEDYFSQFLDTHSWITVKVERNGLQFFWRHILKIDWKWINMVKPPQIKTIPDILSPDEIEQLIGSTRKLRYRVFFLTTYSMGLRLSEALSLQVRDIDADLKRVDIRYGKGKKDRFVPLPYELRSLTWYHQTRVYSIFFACVASTLKDFGLNSKHLGAQIGMTMVLHTHTRKLDYHPHIHVVIPGGGVDQSRRQWKKNKGKYLFNKKTAGPVSTGFACDHHRSTAKAQTGF